VERVYNLWVYIVSKDNDSVLYTGMTHNLPRRIAEHRGGAVPGFTASTVVTNWSITSIAQTRWMQSRARNKSRTGRAQKGEGHHNFESKVE
jgi:predicted GIY-YIG superfamily endonuclease